MSLKNFKRRSIRVSSEVMVAWETLVEGASPLLVRPKTPSFDPISWASGHRGEITDKLSKHGAILFRDFPIDRVEGFRAFAEAIATELLDYVERAAPRNQMAHRVFSSTEYPADQWIPLHHEMSYSHNWPKKLFFYCAEPAADGGFTPIADDREVIRNIPPQIKEPFLEKGVMYVRNFGEGVDMPWQEVFQTDDRDEVCRYLDQTGTQYEWLSDDRLRTRSVRQVTAEHPDTGDVVWFNHAALFHSSNMPVDVRTALEREFAPHELPRNAFYGDGSPIADETAIHLRELYKDSALMFPWQKGDVLMLDNFIMTHGRTPFSGPRKICVAMAELYTHQASGK